MFLALIKYLQDMGPYGLMLGSQSGGVACNIFIHLHHWSFSPSCQGALPEIWKTLYHGNFLFIFHTIIINHI